MLKKVTFVLFSLIAISAYSQKSTFNPESVKPIIIENGKKWGKALRTQNENLISSIYDENAHYLVDGNDTFHGNASITKFWVASFGYLQDLTLVTETIEGTKELIYETGHGTALLGKERTSAKELKFKYVNVWKLQLDGSYKVVIDMFNDVKNEK